MGMYDYIICKRPLPGTAPAWLKPDTQFQTKDISCLMETYEIIEDGRLKQTGGMFGDVEHQFLTDFTDTIDFYDSNWCSLAYGATFTSNGEDSESVEYRATFVNGVLTDLIQTEYERKPALSRQTYQELDSKFTDTKPEINLTTPKIGDELWVLWGGNSTPGYPAKVVAKTELEIAAITTQYGKEKLEVLWIPSLGNTLFHSQQDAEAQRGFEKGIDQQKREYVQQLLSEKQGATV